VYNSLMSKLRLAARTDKPEMTSTLLKAFMFEVHAQSGKHIEKEYAKALITDAQFLIAHLPDSTPPMIVILSPKPMTYGHHDHLFVNFMVTDSITGVDEVVATLDGSPVKDFQRINLSSLSRGTHTLTVTAVDVAGNTATKSVTFKVK
jgi:hypothetical protein